VGWRDKGKEEGAGPWERIDGLGHTYRQASCVKVWPFCFILSEMLFQSIPLREPVSIMESRRSLSDLWSHWEPVLGAMMVVVCGLWCGVVWCGWLIVLVV
jgi:uncharacterized protein (DUF2062 family)